MKTFSITEEYISTINYLVEADTVEEARRMVQEGEVEGSLETDFDSGEITHISDVSAQISRRGA